MKSLLTNPLILGFVAVLVLVAIDPVSCGKYGKKGRNKDCAEGCKSGCHTRGPGKCDSQCQPKWHLQQSTGKCIQNCGKHCAFCLHFRYCLQCVDGHKLEVHRHTRDIICRPAPTGRTGSSGCDPNCATEADTSTATGCSVKGPEKCDGVCKANYVLDPDSNFCEECSLYCVPVIPGSCPGAPGTCSTSCVNGYTIDPVTKLCAACAAGCSTTCSSPGSCDGVCAADFVFEGGICEPCADQCVSGCTTSGAFNCDGNCASGYGPTNTTTGTPHQCAPCDVKCSSGCNAAGAGFCDSACMSGYVLDSGSCKPCQPLPACTSNTCTAPGTCMSGQCSATTTFDSSLNICV